MHERRIDLVVRGKFPGYGFPQGQAHRRLMNRTAERRTRNRVLLRCPLRLYRRGYSQPFDGETKDLSSAGFYCLVRESFFPGDNLDCILTVPAENFSFNTNNVNLHCEVKVTRVDNQPAGFGVACRIDHYSLILRSEQ
jgi:PilZ domain